jgi:hypothetical protein
VGGLGAALVFAIDVIRRLSLKGGFGATMT